MTLFVTVFCLTGSVSLPTSATNDNTIPSGYAERYKYTTEYSTSVFNVLKINGNCTASNFYTSSDIRLKENINNISDSIKEFTWKDSGEKSYGFIAQELEQYNPELIITKNDGYKTVNYNAALCLLVAKLENKIKEQQKEIDELKKYIK